MNYYSPNGDKYDSSQPTYISTPDIPPTYLNSQSGVIPQHYYQQGVPMHPQAASSLQSLAAAQQLALYAQNVQQVGYSQDPSAAYHAASAAHTLSGMSSMYNPVSHMHQGSNYYATAPMPTSNHPYMQPSVQQLHQISSNRGPNSSAGMLQFRGVENPYTQAPTILRPTATPAAGYYSVNYPSSIPGQVLPVSSTYPSGQQHHYT